MQRDYINRKFKATIFEMIFCETEAALSLYNAINNTNYKDASQLEITTLNDALYMGMKNDVSFIIDFVMNLYEHQSTYNPNMPLRGLFYFSRLYEAYIKENGLDPYASTQLLLPKPRYIVFYNGEQELPEKSVLHLTDSFSKDGTESHLEVTAILYNINIGKNREIMQKCHLLQEYAVFIDTIRKYRISGHTYKHSIEKAVNECIAGNILKDFLIHNKAGILKMILSEYDEKLHIETEKRIAVERAQAEWKLHVESEKQLAVKRAQAEWELHVEREKQLAVEHAQAEWKLRLENEIQKIQKQAQQEQLRTEHLLAQTSTALQEALAELRKLKGED